MSILQMLVQLNFIRFVFYSSLIFSIFFLLFVIVVRYSKILGHTAEFPGLDRSGRVNSLRYADIAARCLYIEPRKMAPRFTTV